MINSTFRINFTISSLMR